MLTLSERGRPGDEAQDYGHNFANARRRSNSSTQGHNLSDFKTKFETKDADADIVFEENLHGAMGDEDDLDKVDTADSTSSGSVEEEEHPKHV